MAARPWRRGSEHLLGLLLGQCAGAAGRLVEDDAGGVQKYFEARQQQQRQGGAGAGDGGGEAMEEGQ